MWVYVIISVRPASWPSVWHGKNFNVAIFSGTMNVVDVKLCMMVLLIEHHPFIPLSLYACYIHWKDHAQHDLCGFSVYSREMLSMFLVHQVSVLVKNFHIRIFSDIINMINVKVYMKVLFIEIFLFMLFSVILTIYYQGHSSIKSF